MSAKMVNVEAVSDALTQFMASMPGMNQRAAASSLSSVGYKLKLAAKDAVKTNSLGWPDISNLARMTRAYPATYSPSRTSSAGLAQVNSMGQLRGFSTKAWGALANLLVYSFEKDSGLLLFGFQSGTFGKKIGYSPSTGERVKVDNVIKDGAVTLARKLTEGFEHSINSFKQQRYYAALGFIFRLGTILRCPPRPLVGPVFQSKKSEIPTWFRDKFWERLRSYNEPGKIINQTWKMAA